MNIVGFLYYQADICFKISFTNIVSGFFSTTQLQLLINGFRLLKVGGMLVYSTCSLTVAQNEDIVEQFLSAHPSAELQEIDAAKNWSCKSGKVPKTLRFDPLTSNTSGLFVASFTKLGA